MTNIIDFDWEFYLKYNVDVSECYCYCENGAILHYDTHGKTENRIYSEEMLNKSFPFMKDFDSEYYRENNKDLKDLTHYQLVNHYIFTGYADKRDVHFTSQIYEHTKKTILKKFPNDLKISVIMVISNESETMQYAIDSVLKQSYKNLEIIIVNDNSNKRSKSMLTQYVRNPRVILLDNEHTYGYYQSVNIALSMCSGDYITVHGSSDISLPNRFINVMYLAKTMHLMMVGSHSFKTHLSIQDNASARSSRELFLTSAAKNMLNEDNDNDCCKLNIMSNALMYHKSVFEKINRLDNINGLTKFEAHFLKQYEGVTLETDNFSLEYLLQRPSDEKYRILDEILYIA